jgi:hypothetical protein
VIFHFFGSGLVLHQEHWNFIFSEEFAKMVSNVVVSLVGRGDAAAGGGPAGAPPGRRDQPERLVRRGGGGGTILRRVKPKLHFAKICENKKIWASLENKNCTFWQRFESGFIYSGCGSSILG